MTRERTTLRRVTNTWVERLEYGEVIKHHLVHRGPLRRQGVVVISVGLRNDEVASLAHLVQKVVALHGAVIDR